MATFWELESRQPSGAAVVELRGLEPHPGGRSRPKQKQDLGMRGPGTRGARPEDQSPAESLQEHIRPQTPSPALCGPVMAAFLLVEDGGSFSEEGDPGLCPGMPDTVDDPTEKRGQTEVHTVTGETLPSPFPIWMDARLLQPDLHPPGKRLENSSPGKPHGSEKHWYLKISRGDSPIPANPRL